MTVSSIEASTHPHPLRFRQRRLLHFQGGPTKDFAYFYQRPLKIGQTMVVPKDSGFRETVARKKSWEYGDMAHVLVLYEAKGSRKNKFTFWRERRAGRCKAPGRRRCGDIVEDRQRSRCLPAAAPRRAAAPRPFDV